MNTQIKAVIFDMDGTLIDTEKYYVNFGYQVIREMGYELSMEEVLKLRSLNRTFAKPRMQRLLGKAFDVDEFRARRRAMVEAAISKNGIKGKPYAKEILDFLQENGICRAVATATDLVRAEKYLSEIGLAKRFDKMISVHNVANGKPKPDVYLEACRQLQERPECCMAVEDSPNGVVSAYDAGLRVVMVPDMTLPEPVLEPMLYGVAENLWEIRKFL